MRRIAFFLLFIGVQIGALRAQTAGSLNLALPTLGGDQFWSDQLVYHKLRIQRNELTGHFRLLDSTDVRRAWGTEEECRAALETLKRDKKMSPLKGRAVITLHGLGRTRNAMNAIGRHLEKDGG